MQAVKLVIIHTKAKIASRQSVTALLLYTNNKQQRVSSQSTVQDVLQKHAHVKTEVMLRCLLRCGKDSAQKMQL